MTDFFTSLVARSFGTAPVIRPRIASLFEPVRGTVVPFSRTVTGGQEETFSAADNEVVAAAPRKQKADQRIARVPAKNDYDHETQAADELPAQPLVVSLSQALQEPQRAIATEKAARRDDMEPAPPFTARREAVVETKDSDRAPVVTALPRESQTGRAKHVNLPSTIVPTAEADGNVERGLVVSPGIPAEMQLPDLVLGARMGRRLQENARSRAAGASPLSDSGIQVTIGRIEVRAVRESERPPRHSSSSPVMSLEKYLRERNRRGANE
jgi:hypothetical protein